MSEPIKVAQVVQRLLCLDQEPGADGDLRDLGMTSLKVIELIVALEESLGIPAEESDFELEQWLTIDRIEKALAGWKSRAATHRR